MHLNGNHHPLARTLSHQCARTIRPIAMDVCSSAIPTALERERDTKGLGGEADASPRFPPFPYIKELADLRWDEPRFNLVGRTN